MFRKHRFLLVAIIGTIMVWASCAPAKDLRIPLPQRSKLTPVQRLNREGVDAIRSHRYEKAKGLFYKAYLLDPDDPFTLNNLGYVSELEGKLESAERFYLLASQRTTNAVVDKASLPEIKGTQLKDVLTRAGGSSMQVNRANVEAIRLLSKERAPEAEVVLQRALTINPQSAYTLNNLGVAKEMQGEFEEAAKYYAAATALNSHESIIVALDRNWYGKPVSEMAASNAKQLREKLRDAGNSIEAKAARLSLQGVAAANRNDLKNARQYFQGAYALDPKYAFALNNIGFLAEMDGDLETAHDLYAQAQEAQGSDARVGLATSHAAEGMKLSTVADQSGQQVDAIIEEKHEARQHQDIKVQLKTRNNQKKPDAETNQPQRLNPPGPKPLPEQN